MLTPLEKRRLPPAASSWAAGGWVLCDGVADVPDAGATAQAARSAAHKQMESNFFMLHPSRVRPLRAPQCFRCLTKVLFPGGGAQPTRVTAR